MKKRGLVLHLITRLDLGGAQETVLDTVEDQQKRGRPALLVCGAGGPLLKRARSRVKDLIVLDRLRHPLSPSWDLKAFRDLLRVMDERKPALVHSHGSKAGVLGRIAAFMYGVPWRLHTVHGWSFNPSQGPLTRWLYLGLERLLAPLTTLFLAVARSDINLGLSLGLGRPERYKLCRSAIRLSEFKPRGRRLGTGDWGLPSGSLVVGYLGNLKPQKDPLAFVRVAGLIAERIPKAAFVLAGEGPLRPRVEEEIRKLGLRDRFAMPGWIKDPAPFLRGLDLYLSTAAFEGLPRSLVQALSCGLPAVAYAVNGIPEVLKSGRNGFLVPRGDEEALALAAVRLLRDGVLRRRMARAAASSIGPEFNLDSMTGQLDRIYGGLLDGKA